MSDHHHPDGPFDPDDPLTGMGIAMVGMALQEAAEEEELQRRAQLTPWQRAEEDRRNKELAEKAWAIVAVVVVMGLVFFACLLSTAH